MKYLTCESMPTWFALKDPPKIQVDSVDYFLAKIIKLLSKTVETSSIFPKVFLNRKSSLSFSILKFSLEYTVDIFGILHTALVESERSGRNSHFSSHTEMKLFDESFLRMVESPSESI